LKALAEAPYEPAALQRGYAGQTLHVNVGDGCITAKPVSADMRETFIGGRGFDLWLLWHGIRDTTQWDDPENEIVIASGPCGGTTQVPGSGRSI
ncbi:MAG: aldehyde:ferredoxin oxidoreductase, partial [Anaerolineae bacterium]|nr:aldehyde:ferredoxin oxidoreductase [Anaerolineae bacterium]